MNPALRRYGSKAYQKGRQESRRDALLRAHAPLVRKVAWRMIHRVPSSVDIDDLISVGTLGLLQAIDHFDESKGTRFESFAEFRIKGAMLDELRSCDHMSRTARGRINQIEKARAKLEADLGRAPKVTEIAEVVELPADEVARLLAEDENTTFMTLDDMTPVAAEQTESLSELAAQGGSHGDPFGTHLARELKAALAAEIGKLPDRLQLVLSLYYEQSLNQKEIAAVLDLTESRISQLHSEAVKILRRRMQRLV
ncbi:MAG: sigma-70 family RNA polymerase sigma factor [Bradymonadia bacterium]